MDKPISLSFIQKDIDQQLHVSRTILEAVRTLQRWKRLRLEGEGAANVEIDAVEKLLIRAADDLVDNATKAGLAVAQLLGSNK